MANRNNSDFGIRFERSLKELERTRTLKPVRNILLFACYALVAACVVLLILYLPTRGGKKVIEGVVLYMAFATIFFGVFVAAIDTYISKVFERATEIKNALDTVEKVSEIEGNANCTSGKIPLVVGFLNLIGEHMDNMILEDAAEMSAIFLRLEFARKGQPIKSEILFVYANLAIDGSFENNDSESIRQLAQESNASIVILASPNQGDHITNAVKCAVQRLRTLFLLLTVKALRLVVFLHRYFRGCEAARIC